MSIQQPSAYVLGAVLAGGQSRRMGKEDKCLLTFEGQTLLQRAVHRAKSQVSELVVCTNGDTSRFNDVTAPIIVDTIPGQLGPAAGIISAFHWAQHQKKPVEWLCTFASDTPYFPLNLSHQLLEYAHKGDYDVVIPRTTSLQQKAQSHYAFGLWSVKCLRSLPELLQNGERALRRLVQHFKFGELDLVLPKDAFFNINTPEDWSELKQR